MNNQEFVYFIQCETGSMFKVGATRAGVEQRLKSLQAATPYRLTARYIVGPLRTGDAWILEGLLHDVLLGQRIRGEWFNLPEITSATGDCYIKKLIASLGFIPGAYAYAEIDEPGLQIVIKSTKKIRTDNPWKTNVLRKTDLYGRLCGMARKIGISRTQLIRLAVKEWLERNE